MQFKPQNPDMSRLNIKQKPINPEKQRFHILSKVTNKHKGEASKMNNTMQVVKELQSVLNTDDVACDIDAKHLCVNSRGIKDTGCSIITREFGGAFKKPEVREEFLKYIQLETSFEGL